MKKIKKDRTYRILVPIVLGLLLFSSCSEKNVFLELPEAQSTETLIEAETLEAAEDVSEQRTSAKAVILVHVCGSVKAPGVYEFPEGSRAVDAVEAAGGFADGAAEAAINLAEPLEDGMQLYIPSLSEQEQSMAEEQEHADGLININTAELSELMTLPGIGEARAKAIITYREETGAFERPEDLMKVSGIKEGAYEKVKDLIKVR